VFPGDWGDRVVVLNLLAADLIPLGSLGVIVVKVEAVKVTKNYSLTSSIESSTCKFLNLLILGVVESLESISRRLVESDLSIVTSSKDMGTPSQSVRDS